MSTVRSLQRLLCFVAFLLTLGAATDAHARGFMIINTGEDVMKIADLPPETLQVLAEAGISGRPEVGVMYSHFGLFWLDVARWDPQFVVYVDKGMDGFEYESATVEELVEMTGMSAEQLKKPLRYYFPPGGTMLALIVLLGGPYYLYSEKRAAQRKVELMNDPRYQAAVAAYNNSAEMPDAGERIDAAMKILTSQGIPNEEARTNLVLLCDIPTED